MSLTGYIAATRAQPFAWGVNDCALWSAGAVRACVGIDPAADLRGKYASRWECRQIELRAGGLLELVRSRIDAVPGLVAIGPGGAPEGVGVCRVGALRLCCVLLDGRALMRTDKGLRVADRFDLLAGWTWHKLSR